MPAMSSVEEVMSTPTPTSSAQFSTSDNFQGWWYLGSTCSFFRDPICTWAIDKKSRHTDLNGIVEQLTCDETQTFATSDGYADCFGRTGNTPMATGCDGPRTLVKEGNEDSRIWYVGL